MDSMLLPLLAFAIAGGSGSSGNGVNLAETMVFSSNLLPEMPRTLLAVTNAQNQVADQQRRDNETASELADIWDTKELTKLTEDDLNAHPQVKRLVNLLSSDDRKKIVADGAGSSTASNVAAHIDGDSSVAVARKSSSKSTARS